MYSVTAYDVRDKVPFILMVAVIIFILFFIHKIAQFVGMCGTVEERVQLNSTNNRSARTTVPLTETEYPRQHRAIHQTRTTNSSRFGTIRSTRARFVPLHQRQPDGVQAQLRVESHPAPDASTIGWCVNQPSVAPSAPQMDDS
ncbi:hypothetical protein PRIPAC_88456 [Pristionchus pacificus]|nr:hypothetical protein PRIPAC_88456 [Pristionchus pacificus]